MPWGVIDRTGIGRQRRSVTLWEKKVAWQANKRVAVLALVLCALPFTLSPYPSLAAASASNTCSSMSGITQELRGVRGGPSSDVLASGDDGAMHHYAGQMRESLPRVAVSQPIETAEVFESWLQDFYRFGSSVHAASNRAQSFTPRVTHTLVGFSISATTYGTVSGTFDATVFEASGDNGPRGKALTKGSVNVSDIPSGGYEMIYIGFDEWITVEADEEYWVVFTHAGGDPNNRVVMQVDREDPVYTGGSVGNKYPDEDWLIFEDRTIAFQEWGIAMEEQDGEEEQNGGAGDCACASVEGRISSSELLIGWGTVGLCWGGGYYLMMRVSRRRRID